MCRAEEEDVGEHIPNIEPNRQERLGPHRVTGELVRVFHDLVYPLSRGIIARTGLLLEHDLEIFIDLWRSIHPRQWVEPIVGFVRSDLLVFQFRVEVLFVPFSIILFSTEKPSALDSLSLNRVKE